MEWGEGVSPSWYYSYYTESYHGGETPPPHTTPLKQNSIVARYNTGYYK